LIKAPRGSAFALTLGALLSVAGAGFAQNPTPVPPPAPPPSAPSATSAVAAPAAGTPAVQAAAGPAVKLPDSLSGRSSITYVSGTTAYLANGSRDGVWQNSRVVVLHQGAIVAELKVKFLSSHSAATEIVSSTAPVAIYDSVRFSTTPKDSIKTVARRPAGTQPSALRAIGIRGRVGMSYQYVGGPPDSAGKRATISQPAADIRMDGLNVGGSKFSFSLDARTRYTYSMLPDGNSSTNNMMRVYQANATYWDPRNGLRVTAGRQYVAALSTISLFDGVTAEVDKDHWSFGGVGGYQPDAITMGYSNQILEYGAFVQLHQGPITVDNAATAARWSVTMGGIDSYDNGAINREFMFVQGFYADRHLTVFATQEVDYNRGWKQDLGYPTLDPSSTFITANLSLSNTISLYGGFDNRKNVRLWRDSVTPETVFDDAYREGMWAGFSLSPASIFHFGADARISGGGTAGQASAYTGWLQTAGQMPMQGLLRLRATRYTSLRSDGWLYAINFGMTPVWRLHFNLNGGVRRETNPNVLAGLPDIQTQVRWYGLDMDVGLTRSWFLLFSGMQTYGGVETNQQVYSSLSYRF
jgi:hypothetical protein